MMNLKCKYFTAPFNLIDLLFYFIFLLIIALIGAIVEWQSTVNWANTAVYQNNLNRLAYISSWKTALISVWVFLAWIRLFEYFFVFKKLAKFRLIVNYLLSQLYEVFVMFFFAWIMFAV